MVLEEDRLIKPTSMTVRSPETNEVHTWPLNVEAAQKPLGSDLSVYRWRVLDSGASDNFSEADLLQVTVEWLSRNKAKGSITFELIKKTERDVAWPT